MARNEKISAKLIKEVGEDVASMYGGNLKSYKVDDANQKVRYVMIEHGEVFFTEMTFNEIKEW